MLNGTVFYFFKICIYLLFLERGREGEIEGKNINVWLPLERPLLGTWPATQVCALTGNQTGNPLVCRSALNPLSHTSQGWYSTLECLEICINFKYLYSLP